MATNHLPDHPTWYKDAVIYEVHVRAFYDSNGDGIGDFRGLIERLDYIRDLGANAIWLLPFYPSPLKDDGYDISDYFKIHPAYGNLRDFKMFLREAHRRGLRVITELVLNHTSDQHPWFQRARRAPPGSRERDFYVWSHTPDRYREARVIFKDFEASNWTWDPVAGAYYWHRFYSHQPDLNYDNPAVARAMLRVVDFWLGMGVDGLRLDAVPYLYEREGTSCENLPETHAFLKRLRRYIDERYPNRMLLAEANQWPEDVRAYFGDGDEVHMAFHFPLMPRMFMAIHMEDRFPILDILAQTPAIPEPCQWALFLRNHDELTLETVTDEERDYMYRVYANDPQARVNLGIRRRLAPLLGNHRRKIELMNGLLLSLPGTPVIYYGDEIGMGDNMYLGDRNGVRTPMQWSSDRNAGFSRATPQKLYLPVIIDPEYHCQTVNVEAQQNNPHSLLWWMRRLIALRQRFKAFGRGTLEMLYPDNPKVLAFVRRYGEETILVVANLSRFVQYAELDLSPYAGLTPVELFGRSRFPVAGTAAYPFTLGPHAFYWFALERQAPVEIARDGAAAEVRVPSVQLGAAPARLFDAENRAELERLLPGFLKSRRWFSGQRREVKSAVFADVIPLNQGDEPRALALVRVEYTDADPELYALPLASLWGERAEQLAAELPHTLLCRARLSDGRDGVIYDGLWDRALCQALLDVIARRRRLKGIHGELAGWSTAAFRRLRENLDGGAEPSVLQADQANSSVLFGGQLVLKLFRRMWDGINPEWELGRFLTERVEFEHAPPTAGALEYRRSDGQLATVGVLQGFVPNQGDAWQCVADALSRYFERVMAARPPLSPSFLPGRPILEAAEMERPELVGDFVGSSLETARALGVRTARLHLALTSASDDPAFAPEPFSISYQRSLYQSTRTVARRVLELARRRLPELAGEDRELLSRVVALEDAILRRLQSVVERPIGAERIRCHGDYHLRQVLFTGKDFVIVDFEGEVSRPLSERRLKRSALRDVAGMLESFRRVAHAAVDAQISSGLLRPDERPAIEPWAHVWSYWVSAAFLKAYLDEAGPSPFIPQNREELSVLLRFHLLAHALTQLGHELAGSGGQIRVACEAVIEHSAP